MNSSTLSEYLRGTINEYLKKKSHSLITLSDKSGIHYNTLARILKGRVESPSLETTLGILKVCGAGHNASEVLRSYFPDYDVILDMMQAEQDSERDVFLEVHRLLDDEISFRILLLARTRQGVTTEAIGAKFGELGKSRLETLIQRNWLLVEDGVVKAHARPLGIDFKNNRDFLRALTRLVDSESNGDRGFHWNIVDRLNEEGRQAIRKAAMDYITEVESIRANPRFQGELPSFMGILTGSLSLSEQSIEGKLH